MNNWEDQARHNQWVYGPHDYRTVEAERLAKEQRERDANWTQQLFDSSSSSGSSTNSNKVVCTELHSRGEMTTKLYHACHRYAQDNWTTQHFDGYHLWAVPLVRLMRRNSLARKMVKPIALLRAQHVAYASGLEHRYSMLAHLSCLTIDGVSRTIGRLVAFNLLKSRNYRELYDAA